MVEAVEKTFEKLGDESSPLIDAPLLADSGFHSESNMKMVEDQALNA